jgi:deoxyribodipyrimidine photo-lyase
MKPPLLIYWARRDLRLHDNSALLSAIVDSKENNIPFLPLFILEDYMMEGGPAHQFGLPSRWFLSRALPAFASGFTDFALYQGKAVQVLKQIAEHYTLTVYVNDDVYVDFYTQVDKLQAAGIMVQVLEDALSVPKETRSQEGKLYSVFTPFKKNVWGHFTSRKTEKKADPAEAITLLRKDRHDLPQELETATEAITAAFSTKRLLIVGGETIDLDTLTEPAQLEGWYTTESEALARFKDYLKSGGLDAYSKNRDSLELDVETDGTDRLAYTGKTSKMSLALAWGLVSACTLLNLTQKHFDESFGNPLSSRVSEGAFTFISELIWREFYRYQLFHHPELMDTEFQERFRGTIAWVDKKESLKRFKAWIQGETGYPVVDAAMKQLASTGWMHNRSRMIVASILSKNLGVDWRWGQEYFRAVLIDLDEASNNGGWQWGASVGADPKPIRIFNPGLQAKNYDASGAYQKRWLKNDETFSLLAPSAPIVEHKVAREEALTRYGLGKVESKDY